MLLLDEPTASLDAANRDVVIGMIRDAKARGAAIVGIFHDAEVRDGGRRPPVRDRPAAGRRMTDEIVFTNAALVLPDGWSHGTLVVRAGRSPAIEDGFRACPGASISAATR